MSNDIAISKRLIWIVYIILQQSVAIVMGYVFTFMFNSDMDNLGLWHKVLSSLGVIILMFEGILVLSPENHLTFGLRKSVLNQIHGYIVGIGCAIMTIGNIFAIVKMETHFTTNHGILGLISMILCGICGIGGILTYYSKFVKHMISPIYLKISHVLLGIISFLISLGALASGFYMSLKRKPTATLSLMALTTWTGLAILVISGKRLLTHSKTIFSSISR